MSRSSRAKSKAASAASAGTTGTTGTTGTVTTTSPSAPIVSSVVKRKRTDFNTLKVGDRLSETQYYEIVGTTDKNMRVKNERGFEFSVSKEIIEEGMFNASQFNETKKVSRTVMVDILENTGGAIFTVNFRHIRT